MTPARREAVFYSSQLRVRGTSGSISLLLHSDTYAIVESQVRIQVIAAGYDPTIGFLHGGRRGRPDFVLDLMEPLRPLVDRKVLEFVQTHMFHPGDFTIRSDGVCRLNPEMAKNIVGFVSNGPRCKVLTQRNSIASKQHLCVLA